MRALLTTAAAALLILAAMPATHASTSQPHVHDYWGDRDQVVLVDRTVEADPADDALGLDDPTRSAIPLPFEQDGFGPALVYPGTGHVTVQVSWDGGAEAAADAPRPRVCVTFDGEFPEDCSLHGGAPIRRTFRVSGQTWTIATDQARNDDGHARASDWRFALQPCAEDQLGDRCVPDGRAYHVEIVAHRISGDLPLEPAHPDHWDDREAMSLLDEQEVASGDVAVDARTAYRNAVHGGPTPLFVVDGDDIQVADGKTDIVPPETKTVQAELAWRSATPADLQLRYQTPRTPAGEWNEAGTDGDCGVSAPPAPLPRPIRCEAYEIPITADQVDGIYAEESDWRFGIFRDGDAPTPLVDYKVQLDVDVQR